MEAFFWSQYLRSMSWYSNVRGGGRCLLQQRCWNYKVCRNACWLIHERIMLIWCITKCIRYQSRYILIIKVINNNCKNYLHDADHLFLLFIGEKSCFAEIRALTFLVCSVSERHSPVQCTKTLIATFLWMIINK